MKSGSVGRKTSFWRKFLFLSGTVLLVAGGILFASVFVTVALRSGDYRHIATKGQSALLRAFGGMVLAIVGFIFRGIGTRGLSDPRALRDRWRASQDLDPASKDALQHYEPPWKGPDQPPSL